MKKKILLLVVSCLVCAGITYIVRLPQADTYAVKRKEKLEKRRGNLQKREWWDK